MLTRSVEFTIDEKTGGVLPSVPQFGGVRGEHNATKLSIVTKAVLLADADVVRLSFLLGDGSVVSSDILGNVTVDGHYVGVTYALPRLLTQSAGQLCARLVLSTIDDDGEETETFRSDEMVLWFEDGEIENGTPFWTGVSEMLARTVAAKEAAVTAAHQAQASVDESETNGKRTYEIYQHTLEVYDAAEAAKETAVTSAQTAVDAAKEAEAQNYGAAENYRRAQAAAENAVAFADKAATAFKNSVHYRGAMSGLVAAQLADKRQSDVFYCTDNDKRGFYIYNGTGWEPLKGSAPVKENDSVASCIGTVFPPSQKPAEAAVDGCDIDVMSATADDIHAYIDEAVSGNAAVTKEILGKDASGNYDMVRYTFANREHCAWQRENYPQMYAWKNGDAVLYTESVSPRIGERAYDTPYVQPSGIHTETVTVPAKAAIVKGVRYSQSGGGFVAEATAASLIIPVEETVGADSDNPATIALTNMVGHTTRTAIYYGAENTAFPTSSSMTPVSSDGRTAFHVTHVPVGKWFFVIFINYTGADGEYDGAAVTVNGVTIAAEVCEDSTSAAHATTTTVTTGTESGVPITAVSATNRSRTMNGVEYVRYEDGDASPTVIYTDADDERNSESSITQDGILYHRYPLGDLGANRKKLIPIFLYANEHGVELAGLDESSARYQKYETKMCALVAARLLRDMASGKQAGNPLYNYIRENGMLIVIPVANPFGYNMNVTGITNSQSNGYLNANNVNINRNYDCPGWDVMNPSGSAVEFGAYAGSENETQYIMNTMVECGAAVVMSLHGLGAWEGCCAHQGQKPDGSDYDQEKLSKVVDFLKANYGYTLIYYDRNSDDNTPVMPPPNTPDKASKSPSFITQCGAHGGIVEFSPDDVKTSGWKQEMKATVIENAYAQTLNLMAMWLSDYLEA